MKKLLYSVIFLLDYVPRFGRVWQHTSHGIASKPRWLFQAQGMWGISTLDILNLLDDALETMYPEDDKNK